MTKTMENFSILDKGLTLEGTISCKGKLIIKGTVKGTITGETIVVGEEGAVYADMKAGSVTVGGIFEGKVRALDELIVLSTGNCEGKVVCKDIVVEPGGILNAEVNCLKLQDRLPEKEDLPLLAPPKEAEGKKK
jgi:cytoskeletal protein CcmA (bactofilin family)